MFTMTRNPSYALKEGEIVEISFKKGDPIAVNNKKLSPFKIMDLLNKIGGRNGVGRQDIVENRTIGMKSRGVYETPGGTILYDAHRILEQLVHDRDTSLLKQKLSLEYAQLVYDGRWFCPAREALDAFVNQTQQVVTGTVKMKLYKGNVVSAGVKSDQSLYLEDLASFTDTELYDQKDASGFIRVYGLPMKVNGMVHNQ